MSRVSIIALVVFVALTALVLALRTRSAQRLQAGALELVRPLHTTTNGVTRTFGALGGGLKSLQALESENKILTVENEKLRARNQMLDDLETENNNLRLALDFKKRSQFNLLPARIIARSSSAWWSNVQIDRGEEDGLDSDMPVVTDIGLVGKTTTVARNTAYVLLVTDENCKVAAYVEGTQEKGVVNGERSSQNVQPNLNLSYLSRSAKLQPGQKVFSSGVTGGVFPYNLLLGTIKEFQVRELDAHAILTPAVDVSKLENVFVVLPTRKGAESARSANTSASNGNDRRANDARGVSPAAAAATATPASSRR